MAGGQTQPETTATTPAAVGSGDKNVPGRYQFNFAASGPGHGLRPLRDPGAPQDVDPDNE